MKRTDHILALTTTLFNCSESVLEAFLTKAGELYTVGESRKPGAVSLGAVAPGIEYTYAEWIRQIRSEGLETVRVHPLPGMPGSVAPEIVAALAGASDLLLQLHFKNKHTPARVYRMESFHSPSHDLSPAGFASLLDAQRSPAALWGRVAELMIESNRLNQRTLFEPGDAAFYLRTIEGNEVFAFLGGDLLRESQIEAALLGHPFEIPEHLQPLLIRYPPLFASAEVRSYVYLYTTREVTANELMMLVTAQPFAQLVWEKTNAQLSEFPEPELIPIAVNEWPARLEAMDGAVLQRYASCICRAICILCEEQELKPVIPSEVADAFGPDERDQLRASLRSKEDQFWSLRPTSSPWEYYQFTLINDPGLDFGKLLSASRPGSLVESRKQLTDVLSEIQSFAGTIQSPFQEAFHLAGFLLSELTVAGPAAVTWAAMEEKLQQAGETQTAFSETALQHFGASRWIAEQFEGFGWSPAASLDLVATGIADVFGGMGSWNDAYIELDRETYHRLSSELFLELRSHLAILLSVSGRP